MWELPFGRPALSASRTGPVVPTHSGDDQEQVHVEREFPEDALCPALSALLRARRFCANPQALLPLSLPDARRRTDRARRASGGFAPSQGCRLCADRWRDPCAGTPRASPSRSRNRKWKPPGGGLTPAGPRQGIDLRFSLPLPSSPEGRRHGEAMRASGRSGP